MPNDPIPKIVRRRALMAGETIPSEPTKLPSREGALPSVAKYQPRWFESVACGVGGPPLRPGKLKFPGDEFKPTFGVYLLPSATASGKSTLCMAISAWANDKRCPAAYLNIFEPRCPDYSPYFVNPSGFKTDVEATVPPSQSGKIVLFDSVTSPMLAYSGTDRAYRNQPTFKEGMRPSDRDFFEKLGNIAIGRKAVFIFVVNQNLISYIAALAAVTEGVIGIDDVAHFTYRDRSTGRNDVSVTIPEKYVNASLEYLDAGLYRGSAYQGRHSRGFRL